MKSSSIFRELTDAYATAIGTDAEASAGERSVERVFEAYVREGLLP